MIWSWIPANADRILSLVVEHLRLALIPVVVGLVLSVPLGWLANRYPLARAVFVPAAGVLYTIPSLTLFVVLPGILGTRILSEINIIVALTIYAVSLLIRNVIDGLRSVPPDVQQAAIAVGYGPLRRLLTIELPIAVPVIFAGLRVVTVANISMVSVGAIIGVGGLGVLFTDGFQREYFSPIVVGIVLTLLLALVVDLLLVLLRRLLTPWDRETAPVKTEVAA